MSPPLIKQPAGLLCTVWHDLGEGHAYKFLVWDPDFSIASNAAKWAHLARLIREQPVVGAMVRHQCRTETGLHDGAIHFKTELTVAVPFDNLWDVRSWEPLHVEPSLLSHCPCQDHGFIRGGRWVRA